MTAARTLSVSSAPGPVFGPAFGLTRVIALMNQKGGVGKTTTTVNLSAALAQAGRPTLLIDLDPQAHATLHLGVDPRSVEGSVYDALHDESVTRACVREVRPNLGLLPAVTDLAAAESELSSHTDRQERLGKALDRVKSDYQFVLIDCPPSLGLLTLNALSAAREVIVPMQSHFLALQGLGKLLETIGLVSGGVNPRLRASGVVLCMHEETTKHSREVVSDITGFFESARGSDVPWRGARVYRPPVRRNIKLAECPSFGQTIFEYAPGCPGASDYRQLGEAMIAEWDDLLSRRAGSGSAPVIEVGSGASASRVGAAG